LVSFLVVDCTVMGGRESVNFTGYLICVLSEQNFLTFAVFISIIFGANELHELRMTEALAYRTRDEWAKAMLSGGIIYSLLYVCFLLCMMLLLAAVSGIDFSNLQTPCKGMDWLIPHILYSSDDVNVLKLAAVNVGNLICYCITIAVVYDFTLGVVRRRAAAILAEMTAGIIGLAAVKSVIRWSHAFTPLGNVILSLSYDRWNDSVNWLYWLITDSVLIAGTFYMNRRREFCYDL